ncbi:MAG: hypothetical protein ACTSQO_10475 [Candidatus Helarchaeota archaeon]
MKKLDLELIGTEMLGELKEKINTLEESFNGGAFQDSMDSVSNVLALLSNMKRVIIGLELYHEIYSIGE